jgi:hypothetical protein
MYRTTEYKQIQDKATGANILSVEERYKIELYNEKGELETHHV